MKVFIALCLVFVAAAFAVDTTVTRQKRHPGWGLGSVYAPGWAGAGAWAAGNPWGAGNVWDGGRWAGGRSLGWNGGWNGAWNGAPTAVVGPTVWGNVGAPGWNPNAQPWW